MASVLVVDDDPDVRLLVAFTLEDGGFDVRTESNGHDALAAIAQDEPDAMVLDVMMPALDGFGVLAAMQQQGLGRDTRVMLLTCKTDERDHLRGWRLGADEYLTKPFEPDHLVVRLWALLAVDRPALELRRQDELEKAELLDRIESAFRGRR